MRYAILGATIEQVRSVGATDIKETRRTGIIFATLNKEQAERLRSMGCQVTEVGQVQATVMPPIVAPPVPVAAAPTYTPEQLFWAAKLEDLRSILVPPVYGEGFNIAIIDTGIRETHIKINGRVAYSKNYTSDPMEDTFNHGTAVASIIAAVAPLCNILNLKVLDAEGGGTEEDVVMAIDDCIDLQDTDPSIAPTVINLSLGAEDDGNPNNILRVACRAAIEKSIWVFASAGNGGPDPQTITSPACEEYVFAVGSVSFEPFTISSFSSRGPTVEGLVKPDVVMFGEDILGASSSSDTATIGKSGTSFATPFASGTALLGQEAVIRRAVYQYPIPPGVAPGILDPLEKIYEFWLPRMCGKPEGSIMEKDNAYGYGIGLGDLMAQMLVRPKIDISTIMATVAPLLVIGMLGMVMGGVVKGIR